MELDEVCVFDFELPMDDVLAVTSVRDQRYSEYAAPHGTAEELGDLLPVAKEVLSEDNPHRVGLISVSLFKERKGYPERLSVDEVAEAEEVVVSVRFHVDARHVKSLKQVVARLNDKRRAELLNQREQLLAELDAVYSLLDE